MLIIAFLHSGGNFCQVKKSRKIRGFRLTAVLINQKCVASDLVVSPKLLVNSKGYTYLKTQNFLQVELCQKFDQIKGYRFTLKKYSLIYLLNLIEASLIETIHPWLFLFFDCSN